MTRDERRQSVLTDDDMERFAEVMERSWVRYAESIGFDVSTPSTRAEIYADHRFVRNARQVKGRILAGFITAIGSAVSMIFYMAAQWFFKRGQS